MPNVFSPNNDKINDLFVIYPHYYKSVTWQIYDRWGNLMHKASEEIKPQKNDEIILWNGKVNEKEASAGTYYYTIELLHSSGKSKTLKGFISLVK
jgi:gliding motility-associated-like protein